MSGLLWQWIDRYLIPVDDPGSRLFGLNVLSSLLLLGLFLWLKKSGDGDGLWAQMRRLVLDRRYWWNRSTRVDYALYFLNSLLKVALLAPFVQLSFWFSAAALKLLIARFGVIPSFPPSLGYLLLFSLAAFVFDDFLRFAHHLAMHKAPLLRRWHSVHHSATVLTPITLYRLHPLESAMAGARNSLSAGISLGFFLFLFDGESNLHSLLGTATFGLLFNFLGSNLRHSHVALSFGPLERVLISPAQHQLHHERGARQVNYGVSLAVWDSLLGSLVLYRPGKKIRFGLRRKRPKPFAGPRLHPGSRPLFGEFPPRAPRSL
jgi:sterol desaturase/sphingolipid hydroxylase (fatty acid hydroxylase superfamily)